MNVVRNQLFCSLYALAMLLLPFSSVLRFGQLTTNESQNNHFGIDFQHQEGHVIFSRHACVRACMRTRELATEHIILLMVAVAKQKNLPLFH